MSSCDESSINKNYIVQTPTDFDILSACTGFYTNNIYNCTGDTLTLHSNTVSANTINSTVYLSGGTNLLDIFGSLDNYTTGATLIGSTAYFDRSDTLSAYTLDLSSLDVNDTFVSGGTYNEGTTSIDFSGNSVETTFSVSLSGISSNIDIYNTYFVSPTGDDSTAVRGDLHNPFKTITAARNKVVGELSASTVTGSTLIYVYPGNYIDQEVQYENGNFYFTPNTVVTLVQNTTANKTDVFRLGTSLVNTSNIYSANTCNIYGQAKFIVSASTDNALGGGVISTYGDAKSHFECDSAYGVKGTLFSTFGNSELKLKANELELITNDYVLTFRESSKTFIDVDRIKGGTGGWAVYYFGFNGQSILNVDELVGGTTFQPLGLRSVSDGAEIVLNINKLAHEPDAGTQWLINNTFQSGGKITYNGNMNGTANGIIYGGIASGGEFNYNGDILVANTAIFQGFPGVSSTDHKFNFNGTISVSGNSTTPTLFNGGTITLNGSLLDLGGTGTNGISTTSSTDLRVDNFRVEGVTTNSIIGSGNVDIFNSLYIDKPIGGTVTTTGQYTFTGTTYDGDLNIYNTPTNDNTLTEILGRNSTTGDVEYRDVESIISAATSQDTFVTGYTYDNANTFTISDNSGNTFNATINTVTGLTVNGDLSATTVSACTGIYTSNLHGCSPVTVHDNLQHISSSATGINSIAWGTGTTASGNFSHAEGQSTIAGAGHTGYYTGYVSGSHAEGVRTVAIGGGSHSEGVETTATTWTYYGYVFGGSHAEGLRTTSSGGYSHAEGYNTTASGRYSHAEGSNTTASGSYSHAEGSNTTSSNYMTHAEGYNTTSSGYYSHAEGFNTTSSGGGSHTEGKQTIASGEGSHAEGLSTTSIGGGSHAEGSGTTASGKYSHAEGQSTIAGTGHTGYYGNYFSGSHAEGVRTVAIGGGSHAEGIQTTATTGYNFGVVGGSHAEGLGTISSGGYSHSEGVVTKASGYASHAEGGITIASGSISHAEGFRTTASGTYSHAEGSNTTSSGDRSHAEGAITTASGEGSHAEGRNTTASGSYSHAEGAITTASGEGSHAEGFRTTASGIGSHSGGRGINPSNKIVASGDASFAHFRQTTPSGDIGAYGDYSVIIGGNDHNIGTGSTSSGIFAGSGNTISDDVLRTVVLGGGNIAGTTDDTVYVPYLNINNIDNDDSLTQILSRDNSDGSIKYRDVSSISTDDFYVSGGSYNSSSKEINFTGNSAQTTFDVDLTTLFSSVSGDTFIVSGNADAGNSELTFTYNTGGTITVTNSAALFSDNDINVTGGTYNPSNGCVTFGTNSGTTFDVCGFVTGITDTYTTGSTLVGETIQFDNNILGLNYYNVSLSPVLSGKTNNSTFNTYTSDTQTILNSKVSNGINNGGGSEIFSGKSGTDLYFRTLSGGSNTTLTTVGDVVKIDVAVPSGDNFFSTAGTVTQSATTGSTEISLQIVGTSGFTPYTITGLTDTFVNDFTFSSNTFTITQNDGSSFDSSVETIELGNILSAVTFDIGTSGSISATTFNGDTFSGGTFYGDGSNLTGITDNDTFVTGFTYDNSNNLTISRNDGTGFTTNFSTMSGLTVNGTLSATTLDGSTILSGGTNLLTIIDDRDTFVTGTTFTGNQSILSRNDGSDVLKISGGSNVTITSGGTNLTVIDVSIPLDNNTFVTGGTYNPSTVDLDFSGNTGFLPFSVDVSALKDDTNTFVTGFTYDDINTFTITDNTGSAFTASVNVLSATTISGGTLFGDGSNLTGISTENTTITGFTYNDANTFTISDSSGTTFDASINIMTGLTVNGDLNVNGESVFSGTGTDVVQIYGSGSTTPIFRVEGSAGELFSISDGLIGDLFTVNNISGLPILVVNSDNTILWGDNTVPSLNTTVKKSINSGLTEIYSVPVSAYTGGFFDYTVTGTGARSGSIASIFSGTTVQFNETTTNDIGDTSGITFDMNISGGTANLTVSATTNSWEIRTIVRSI